MTQTNAQRLADVLESMPSNDSYDEYTSDAATELRRLDAIEQTAIENDAAFDREREERIKAQGEAKQLAKMLDEADAKVAQLRAELEAVRRDAWQPIETAPKDGSLFICWVSAIRYGETDEGQPYQEDVSQLDFCNWRTQSDIPDCGWFDPCCGQIGDEQGVTHWMPLPPSPIDATQAERAKGCTP